MESLPPESKATNFIAVELLSAMDNGMVAVDILMMNTSAVHQLR